MRDIQLNADAAFNKLAARNAKLAAELSVAEQKIEQLIEYIDELEAGETGEVENNNGLTLV